MSRHSEGGATLLKRVESRVRESTHDRIRDLRVEEVQGQLVVRGQVSSHHTRQLALKGALEVIPSERFRVCITVG